MLTRVKFPVAKGKCTRGYSEVQPTHNATWWLTVESKREGREEIPEV